MTTPSTNLPSRLWQFTIISLGLPLTVLASTQVVSQGNWVWLWLALSVALTSSLGTRISLRGLGLGGMTITASDCITLMVLILLNIWVAVLLAVVDATVVVLKMRVRRLDRRLFNLSQMAVTAFVAGLFFNWLQPKLAQLEVSWALWLTAIFLTGLLYYLTNFTLITVAMVLHSGESLSAIWNGNLPRLSPTLILNLVAGVGFFLPLIVPGSSHLIWALLFGSAGLVSSLFYSRRLAGERLVIFA